MEHAPPQPLLVPTPRRLVRPGTATGPLGSPPVAAIDPALPPQGYRLRVDGAETPGVRIESADDAGRRHALATLAQLRRQFGDRGPSLVIEDWPQIAGRGVMLDISRCRVPTMLELRRKVSLLGALKLNHLQLYTEHTFAYDGREDVWGGSSPMTPAQCRRLSRWCERAGIELAANQNCFGHLDRWLRVPRYAHLAETHGEFDFFGLSMRGPFSLCPVDDGSVEFVRALLAELCPNFASRLVNIGCDETLDVGSGRSKSRVDAAGRTRVYVEFVRRICQIVESLGRRPMLWGDIALSAPTSLRDIPDPAVILAWGYEPDSPFDRWGATLRDAGREFWVCPGTSAWRSFIGRTSERRANLQEAVRAAHEHRAGGLLLTDWGDLGHRQQDPIGLLAIAEAAALAWNPDVPPDSRAISWHVFGDPSGRTAAWLAELGDLDRDLRAISGPTDQHGRATPLRNASALFEAIHPSGFTVSLPRDEAPWRGVLDRLETLRAAMPAPVEAGAAQEPEFAPRLLADELRHAADQAELAARIAIARRAPVNRRWREDVRDRIDAIVTEQRRLWLARSRVGGLAESLAYWHALPEAAALAT